MLWRLTASQIAADRGMVPLWFSLYCLKVKIKWNWNEMSFFTEMKICSSYLRCAWNYLLQNSRVLLVKLLILQISIVKSCSSWALGSYVPISIKFTFISVFISCKKELHQLFMCFSFSQQNKSILHESWVVIERWLVRWL